MLGVHPGRSALLGALLALCGARARAAVPRIELRVPVLTDSVVRVDAVPSVDRGDAVVDFASAFPRQPLRSRGGSVTVVAGREPVYILDGDTAAASRTPATASPFGFHPAMEFGSPDPFAAAREIGIRWHRGLYAYWILIQPEQEDIDQGVSHWSQNDREWGAVPPSMAILGMSSAGLCNRRLNVRRTAVIIVAWA